VEDLNIVQGFESSDNLNKDPPDIFFPDVLLLLLVLSYFLEQIAVIRKLHYDA